MQPGWGLFNPIQTLLTVITSLRIPFKPYSRPGIMAFCSVLVFSCLSMTEVRGEISPTQAMKVTIDQVMQVLGDQALKDPRRVAERRAKVEEIISKRFNYTEMAKRTLGSQWKKLSKEQQQEFVVLFQQFLARSYAGNVDGYSGEQVEYIKERVKGNFAEVQTKVISAKGNIPLDYRLVKTDGDWGAYDVVIDGVSLMKNYRGQFSRIIQSSSFDALLDKLRSKATLKTSS